MRTAAILGTGLIGASIGLELRRLGWRTVGWDPDGEVLRVALQRAAVDDAAASDVDAVSGADVVFLAGPLSAAIATVRHLETPALVTDVAGVKQPVVDAARGRLRFVGGHPMAGREHAGPAAATHSLFRGASWVITTDGAARTDIEKLSAIVSSMGAIPREMTAAEHDESVARISHVPHLLAAALLAGFAEDSMSQLLAAGSFRDLTRVASSDVGWWPEVLVANAHHVDLAIDQLIAELAELRHAANRAAFDELRTRLDRARTRRHDLAPAVVRIGVVLQDKPGEIAAVGRALEQSSVDVRDLQLRHAPHGGGGVLTLSVRPGEGEALRHALVSEGFEVE
ncbi:MAG: prephenate dehydrogenase/arogenate dehydrogenase family protein [Acidimicrobiia bacterium]|nr:prephenate dehydrogenase/arogenate dehydrogenase family protein [Acidimicrobiia bacterium]